MPAAINSSVAEFAFAKNTGGAEGSIPANPTYAVPVFSGLPAPTHNIQPIEVTDTTNVQPMVWKTDEHWEADVTLPGFPASLPALVKGILSSESITGAADPYTHTNTNSTAADPFYTFWSRRPGPLYEKFADGLISELTLSFDDENPVQVSINAMGKNPSVLGSTYTATTTEVLSPTSEFFTPVGATLKLDVAATPATTTVTNLRSGSITFRRDVELLGAVESITPGFVYVGKLEVMVALDAVWTNYDAYRATFYGATAGTAASATIVSGSIDFTFPSTNSATHTLQIQVPSVALMVNDAPQPDASGGPFTFSIDGMGLRPASGSIATVVTKNAVATTY